MMAVSFKGAHFPQEIILTGVRWYVAYPLSTRHVEELMLERGVNVDHSTINRWVIKYSPQLEEAFHRRKRPVWVSWRMDETYIKIKGQWAVAQKSPCEGKRVIMGQEFPLKLGQRRQDASEEVPMRTPKQLYAHQRIIYQPALLTCPHCGDLLVMCNSLAWDKTVQTFDRVLSVASRPGHCPHVTCAGSRMRLLSAQAQRLALPGSTYGYDVLVRMAWWRQESRATYHEMHTALASQVRISASHVGSLSQQVSLPLLACHERQHRDHRAHIAQEQGGVMIALDGLAPQGGEPHMWFIRARTSGFTFRRGWLSQQDQTTFDALLQPLTHLAWPILAVLSDKQTGLVPAVATVCPPVALRFVRPISGATWLRPWPRPRRPARESGATPCASRWGT